MNKQQTTVELFATALYEGGYLQGNGDEIQNLLEQHLEMEKEQNKNYLKEYFEWHKSMGFVSHKPEDIIEFNETYGGNK
jgi:hypothetical protein